eukprot:9482348-Pyramimonas_sp.AAC.1
MHILRLRCPMKPARQPQGSSKKEGDTVGVRARWLCIFVRFSCLRQVPPPCQPILLGGDCSWGRVRPSRVTPLASRLGRVVERVMGMMGVMPMMSIIADGDRDGDDDIDVFVYDDAADDDNESDDDDADYDIAD